jgi:hypothetical protein
MEVQNVVVQNERLKFQSFDRGQAIARGDMMFSISHCAEVNGKIPNLFLDWSVLRPNPFLNLITGKRAVR